MSGGSVLGTSALKGSRKEEAVLCGYWEARKGICVRGAVANLLMGVAGRNWSREINTQFGEVKEEVQSPDG